MPPVEPLSLPDPPPPRPAARDAAIEAAMRRFDGLPDQPKPGTKPRRLWQRPQLQWAMAASLLLVVGLPATFIAIRGQGSAPSAFEQPVSHPPVASERAAPSMNFAPQPDREPAVVEPKVAAPAPVSPARPQPPDAKVPPSASPMVVTGTEPARDEAYAAAPPPPAPPPPPPPPPPAPAASAMAQKTAEADNTIILTGSRIATPARRPDRAYARFLAQLQSAVRSDNRGAVIKLIRFPLRVNSNGQSRIYADAPSVRRDFDRIFTSRVTDAILAQQPGQLFVRDQGAMIGDGEVWFDEVCSARRCSPPGPVRIIAVNP